MRLADEVFEALFDILGGIHLLLLLKPKDARRTKQLRIMKAQIQEIIIKADRMIVKEEE